MKAATLLAISLGLVSSGLAQQQAQQNPFAPPSASMHYAPDRTCDLLHVSVDVDVDYPDRTVKGTSVNTMRALRSGIDEVMLMAGTGLEILLVKVDGVKAEFRREGRLLYIKVPTLKKGQDVAITTEFASKDAKGRTFGAGGGGWHWIVGNAQNPDHVGFWTQGETEYNSEWCPTWDYPNDLATSESRCTVPADWNVVGNGVLTGTKLSADGKRKTYDWKMTQPHATYLLSLCGGPFDIKKDKWEGVDLWYVVPKGEGYMIDESFGHTKDMLTFYSQALGVKYAWPKYAQDAMYDFGGGMENVSCTTLGEGSLTEPRDGWYRMDSLNSHELGHQWFGDLVTCKDWGDAWLNESFATYMQIMYFQHSRGPAGYDWEIENAMRSYFAEARRYKRPISTKMYPRADNMFDSHTYPKGGCVLHTLRQWLGDESFFGGLNYYLTKWRHTPVESAQLRRAFVEATGINVEAFWAQWFDKPGHPVLDTTWTQSDGKIHLTVRQIQDTSDGTPVYDIPAKVDLITAGGTHHLVPVHLTKTEETFTMDSPGAVKAVVFDPKHDFLREIPKLHWSKEELPTILEFGLNAVDRQTALTMLLEDQSADNIKLAAGVAAKDNGLQSVFRDLSGLANPPKPELRSFWLGELKNENVDRQAYAVTALAQLPPDAETTKRLQNLVNDKAPIQVVVNSINALAGWDAKGNLDLFKKAVTIKDRRGRIRLVAQHGIDIATGK